MPVKDADQEGRKVDVTYCFHFSLPFYFQAHTLFEMPAVHLEADLTNPYKPLSHLGNTAQLCNTICLWQAIVIATYTIFYCFQPY